MHTLARQTATLRHLIVTPAVAIFLASLLVNVGNLGFNMIFSRLMGPDLFGALAFMLTLKLSALSLFGAVQTAVSHRVASASLAERGGLLSGLAWLNNRLFVTLVVLCLPFGIALWAVLGPAAISPLLLVAALPFGAALSLLRGVSFGSLHTRQIVVSANLEMAVRLVLALVAWGLGLGLPGVTAAISLSIIAGWVVLVHELPAAKTATAAAPLLKVIGFGAAPFALLQLAQVLALDGDIFIASSTLPASESGMIAALSLFQRIQFFACVSLAAVLLPDLKRAQREGQPIRSALAPVALLFVSVSFAVVAACTLFPQLMMSLLVGPGYQAAAASLPLAALSAIAFTFSYLTATALVAFDDRSGIWLCIGLAGLQLVAMALTPDPSVASYVTVKLVCQLLGAAISLGLILRTAASARPALAV